MNKIKILLVEDDQDVSKAITKQLNNFFDVCYNAKKGTEAIQKVVELKPDLILMDIQLQDELNGIETAKIIQAKIDIPIIYLSGISNQQVIKEAQETNPYGYLIKPILKKDLKIAIEMTMYKFDIDKKLKKSEKKYKEIVENNVLYSKIQPAFYKLRDGLEKILDEFENMLLMGELK